MIKYFFFALTLTTSVIPSLFGADQNPEDAHLPHAGEKRTTPEQPRAQRAPKQPKRTQTNLTKSLKKKLSAFSETHITNIAKTIYPDTTSAIFLNLKQNIKKLLTPNNKSFIYLVTPEERTIVLNDLHLEYPEINLTPKKHSLFIGYFDIFQIAPNDDPASFLSYPTYNEKQGTIFFGNKEILETTLQRLAKDLLIHDFFVQNTELLNKNDKSDHIGYLIHDFFVQNTELLNKNDKSDHIGYMNIFFSYAYAIMTLHKRLEEQFPDKVQTLKHALDKTTILKKDLTFDVTARWIIQHYSILYSMAPFRLITNSLADNQILSLFPSFWITTPRIHNIRNPLNILDQCIKDHTLHQPAHQRSSPDFTLINNKLIYSFAKKFIMLAQVVVSNKQQKKIQLIQDISFEEFTKKFQILGFFIFKFHELYTEMLTTCGSDSTFTPPFPRFPLTEAFHIPNIPKQINDFMQKNAQTYFTSFNHIIEVFTSFFEALPLQNSPLYPAYFEKRFMENTKTTHLNQHEYEKFFTTRLNDFYKKSTNFIQFEHHVGAYSVFKNIFNKSHYSESFALSYCVTLLHNFEAPITLEEYDQIRTTNFENISKSDEEPKNLTQNF